MKAIRYKKKTKTGFCSAYYCKNETDSPKAVLCHNCRSRKSRLNDPVRYYYNNLKSSARKRGKVFTISLEYFSQFCYQYKLIGRTSQKGKYGLTVDRIKEELGYIEGNLQVKTRSANVKKYFSYNWETKEVNITKPDETIIEDLPF